MSQTYQFTGFKEKDHVVVIRNDGTTLNGVMAFICEADASAGGDYAQTHLLLEDNSYALLESGPDAMSSFTFKTIARRIAVSV